MRLEASSAISSISSAMRLNYWIASFTDLSGCCRPIDDVNLNHTAWSGVPSK